MTTFSTSSRRGFLVLSGMGIVLAGCSTVGVLAPTPGATDRTAAAWPRGNELRRKNGLSALSSVNPARKAAAVQAVRMAKADEMQHLIGLGDSFYSRMKASDVTLPAAENIASGQNEVERAVQAWIDSPKHLHNMLGTYSGLGVAVAYAADGRAYWSMILSS